MTNAVVERCPNCGVEHDISHEGPCEVCGHELRPWCQRHSREIGWLSGPECPVCQREAEAPPPPAPVAPPPSATTRRPPERHPVPGTRREPRAPTERHPPRPVRPEDLVPHLATGAGLALRLVRAVVVLVRSVLLWALLGAAVGAAYAVMVGGELLWVAGFGLMGGAVLGFVLGLLPALFSLFRGGRRR